MYWSRVAEDPKRRRILCSAVEHHAVLDTVEWLERHEGADVVWLPVDGEGVVDPGVLEAELSRDPGTVALVTVMWANNEVGTVQPIGRIVELAHAAGVPRADAAGLHVTPLGYGHYELDGHEIATMTEPDVRKMFVTLPDLFKVTMVAVY